MPASAHMVAMDTNAPDLDRADLAKAAAAIDELLPMLTGYLPDAGDLSTAELLATAALRAVQEAEPYVSTPLGHLDAWADTGEGYSVHRGYTITCLWCGARFEGKTKAEAMKGYDAHEAKIKELAEAERKARG